MEPLPKHYTNESLPGEYHHSFHAGNVGDVWKHTVLLSVLSALTKQSRAIDVVDCYAGAGSYVLQSTGEWTEGIGALQKNAGTSLVCAVKRYLNSISEPFSSKRHYLGSPKLIEEFLRPADSLTCFETGAEAARLLASSVSSKTKTLQSDGLAGLFDHAASCHKSNRQLMALIDPPWIKKEDWNAVPNALIEAWKKGPRGVFILWYPIKSYTRVNTMLKAFDSANVPYLGLDLLTTPLELKRNRLNGSGLVVVNSPAGVSEEIGEAASVIGRACATHQGYWSYRAAESGTR